MDVIWIGNVGIGGEEFVPAGAAAKMAAREFPEGIAGLDADFGGARIIYGRSDWHGARHKRRNRRNWSGRKQQFRRRGRRRGADRRSVWHCIGERDGGFRWSGQIWRERRAFAGERWRKYLARKRVAAGWANAGKRLRTLVRMGIWRDARCDRLHGSGERRLREIHGEAGWRLTLRGFGGLRIFEFLAAVTAGYFSQTFGCGILFGVDGGLSGIRRSCCGIIFPGLDARTILLGQDLRLL